ncbi:hypothetical protein PR202_gb22947 [Eleusine coracana subsp. coracana]|uniref:BSD2 cysteine rich domain-containing protein n=1 Tax=Eleusine coracana subsp. coracana TaxID=191504 RepID=A0AAV5FHX0_ELECO|nr:hypothetical protein PR202_gb22947 [Eleusine coracana subsp. coracana]
MNLPSRRRIFSLIGVDCPAPPSSLAVRYLLCSLFLVRYSSPMAATASLTAIAPSPPAHLKTSPPAVISLRPVSRRCKLVSVKTKFHCKCTGAIVCTQCKGSGVNSVDHFNGRFKAGALCWLCRYYFY